MVSKSGLEFHNVYFEGFPYRKFVIQFTSGEHLLRVAEEWAGLGLELTNVYGARKRSERRH